MPKPRKIDAEIVRALLYYSPKTGELKWKERTEDWFPGTVGRTPSHACRQWNATHAGKKPGAVDSWGHTQIRLFGRLYGAHRLIWLLMTGKWPKNQIDHIDCDPSNNRWNNLRPATNTENVRNQRAPRSNSSGVKGVSWSKEKRKWVAYITANRRRIHLGQFENIEDAEAAYAKASKKHHGEYGRTSRKE